MNEKSSEFMDTLVQAARELKVPRPLTTAAQAYRYLTKMPMKSVVFILGEDENNKIVTPSTDEIRVSEEYSLYTELLLMAELLEMDGVGRLSITDIGRKAMEFFFYN